MDGRARCASAVSAMSGRVVAGEGCEDETSRSGGVGGRTAEEEKGEVNSEPAEESEKKTGARRATRESRGRGFCGRRVEGGCGGGRGWEGLEGERERERESARAGMWV